MFLKQIVFMQTSGKLCKNKFLHVHLKQIAKNMFKHSIFTKICC